MFPTTCNADKAKSQAAKQAYSLDSAKQQIAIKTCNNPQLKVTSTSLLATFTRVIASPQYLSFYPIFPGTSSHRREEFRGEEKSSISNKDFQKAVQKVQLYPTKVIFRPCLPLANSRTCQPVPESMPQPRGREMRTSLGLLPSVNSALNESGEDCRAVLTVVTLSVPPVPCFRSHLISLPRLPSLARLPQPIRPWSPVA